MLHFSWGKKMLTNKSHLGTSVFIQLLPNSRNPWDSRQFANSKSPWDSSQWIFQERLKKEDGREEFLIQVEDGQKKYKGEDEQEKCKGEDEKQKCQGKTWDKNRVSLEIHWSHNWWVDWGKGTTREQWLFNCKSMDAVGDGSNVLNVDF